MGNVTLPHPLSANTKARGSEVLANDQAITAQVNANLDDSNYKNAGMTLSSKAVPGSATNTVLGADSVSQEKVADQAIQAEHLKNDSGLPPTGIGAPRNELFSESDQAAITNVVAGRQQQGGKTVWAYFKLTAADTAIVIDDSIDWRRRIIRITLWVFGHSGASGLVLPNGASDNAAAAAAWNATIAAFGGINTGLFYSEDGRVDGGTPQPVLFTGWVVTANTALQWYALDTNGALKCKSNSSLNGNAELNVYAEINCSPYIGV